MHDSNRSTRLLAIATAAIGMTWSALAQARAIEVPCDEAALRFALEEAGFNGQEDVLTLAPSCRYALSGILIAYPDAGLPTTIRGNAATIDALGQRTALLVNPGVILDVYDVTITEGRAGPTASGDGGAIFNVGQLGLTRSVVSNSEARTGGGIFNSEGASLTLVRSTVSGNTAGAGGGGIANDHGRITLIDTSVIGNTAQGQSGVGAGIFNDAWGPGPRAVATLSNCTIAGNASRFGAGIFNEGGKVSVSHCTIAGNDAIDGGNGAAIYQRELVGTAEFRLANSIVDGGGDGFDCVRDPFVAANVITPSGVNLVQDGSCEVVGALTGNPGLGALVGSPAVFPLVPGSPAIDRADDARCPGVDQRGSPRPRDGNQDGSLLCDLGAYELQ